MMMSKQDQHGAGRSGELVRVDRDGRVAVVTLDNPPVNTSTADLRSQLLAAVRSLSADDSFEAVVLIGGGRHFLSGSDLREFAGDLPKPELPEVIAAIEECPKPVVAALSGTTFGGGFELALGCDARIALAGGRGGFPEATLGMIPGGGGTQRCLRLVAPSRVLDLVTSGRALTVEQAGEEGLVDEVVPGSLREAAVGFARRVEGKRILREEPPLGDAPGAIEGAAERALTRDGPRPVVGAAIGAVFAGLSVPANKAFEHERAEFNRLRVTREAAALRHLFFARAESRKRDRAGGSGAISAVGVVGAGTMGTGIARAFAEAGVAVTLVDRDHAVAAGARASLEETYARQVSTGRIGSATAEERLEMLGVGNDLNDLVGAGLVVEAVFEDHAVKTEVLTALEAKLESGVPLATNTSYLDVDALAAQLRDPSRLVGMHFFSPAHRSEVLEVVEAEKTSATAVDRARTAAKVLRKVPVIAGACEGFIGNRVYNAYRRQCELLVEDGASPESVDAALTAFGFAMGPFAVADMAGLDIAWRERRRRDPERDPRERYPVVADRLVELGRLGQKTSAGWYSYDPGSRTPRTDPVVDELIANSRAQKGIEPHRISNEEVVDRCLAAMANEAALLLEEGIVDRPSDIDLVLTLGYGFPAREGGIAFWASGRERSELLEGQRRLAEATGWGFRRGELSRLA